MASCLRLRPLGWFPRYDRLGRDATRPDAKSDQTLSLLIAAPLMLIAGLSFAVTGDPNSAFSSVLYAPLGLQEMVLAVWLIARGFNPPADADWK